MAIDTVNNIFVKRMDEWSLYDSLCGGTKVMRDKGEVYLPKEPKESDEAYLSRIARSVLFNGFKSTLRTLSSRPFIKPIKWDGLTEQEESYTENIDRRGTSLDTFSKKILMQCLKKNFAVVLTDHPVVDGETDLETQVTQDLRGYPVIIPNEYLIDFKIEQNEGRDRIIEFRYFEFVEEPDPEDTWTMQIVKKIRVWTPETIFLYTAGDATAEGVKGTDKNTWDLEEEFPNTLGEVPVEILYQDRQAMFDSDNNLNDLAYLNLNHWQSSSDQQNILHVARVPILHYAGWNEESQITVGPNTMIKSTDSNSRLEFVEHGGSAIGAGSTEIDKIEDRMAVMGSDMLVRRDASKTATEKLLNEEAETSELASLVVQLEDMLSNIFSWISKWQEPTSDGSEAKFTIFKDFAINIENQDVNALLNMKNTNNITQETLLMEMKRRGILSDSLDVEAETEKTQLGDSGEDFV
jgi:hypothetical protein